MTDSHGTRLLRTLPPVRGRLQADAPLADLTWFRVGGPADVLFVPADEEDLAGFLGMLGAEVPVLVIGVGSNLLVRDGGVRGVVIRLGRGFGQLEALDGQCIRAGAAVPDMTVARFASEHGIGSLTFLRGIPGTMGGALRMNGGAYSCEIKDVLVEASAIDRRGMHRTMSLADMRYSYRHCGAPEDLIFTGALLQGQAAPVADLVREMDAITAAREASQPVRSRTGGSTFKNPPGVRAWELIDRAGLRGFGVGPAKMSELHCNFLINEGGATAAQIETLGEMVRQRVLEQSGITLEWEIRRIGEPLATEKTV